MPDFLPIAYFEGKFIPFVEANISIATHALHYGTGAFGGLRGTINPANPQQVLLFRLDRHCQRLSNSAKYLHYDLSPTKIEEVIKDFVSKNKPTNAFYIRPFVYTSDLGIAPRLHNIEKNFFVYGLEMGDYLSPDGINCRLSSWYRQEDRSLPLRGKISGAYITSALAKTEAVDSGFDEAILMNSQGKVCEATGMNIFMVRNNKLITPSFDQDILEGITRDSILTIAKNFNIEIEQREIDKTELFIADEVFLCGTAAKITPVKRVENYPLPEEKIITNKIKEKLTAITENRDVEYQDWITVIDV
ncbi:MAG: branched-chain amino acid transaminase [Cyanobacteria bacterium]|nr:branched-chain amino acid transaminase [Cyanobacteria bacterium CG_2015-16_32_12]NCO77974.1 branched-chain amino acid transaminase [Cyanobacteria bacterium CG_2015-22_32_23]NCQ04455.1 branched-chain amino acid transaminase [Cyanobacteria bacterium CG_2015-09_32_10]NCQ43311.1 branched-chain amino acid transaminase [Cyanobacteria bacterium CG_2015-04_32_10]NCS85305.1 branched-chain amino acid transaminase [Cyanobacteria bacterium CG_2015-02_32_10]